MENGQKFGDWTVVDSEMIRRKDEHGTRLGYEIANVVPCCKPCNRAKDTMTQAEFLEKARRIVATHPL